MTFIVPIITFLFLNFFSCEARERPIFPVKRSNTSHYSKPSVQTKPVAVSQKSSIGTKFKKAFKVIGIAIGTMAGVLFVAGIGFCAYVTGMTIRMMGYR